jgi:SAM-dependent methyltransferase
MPVPRSAQIYADFLLPHLTSGTRLLDVGCGSGELSLGLAAAVGTLTGVDADPQEITAARTRAEASGVSNATFEVGDVYALAAADGRFDVVFAHSVLEALDRPANAIAQMSRVLAPGGLLAVASVEYGGLILAGPHSALTRRFYDVREHLWLNVAASNPYLGRELRGLLVTGGLSRVEATTTYLCYGTPEAVRDFGRDRADDCRDPWYASSAVQSGLAAPSDLEAMRAAWLEWSESSTSYAAFAWCRALGWNDAPAG